MKNDSPSRVVKSKIIPTGDKVVEEKSFLVHILYQNPPNGQS